MSIYLQVFAVRSGGATGVVIKGPDERTSKNFRYENSKSLIRHTAGPPDILRFTFACLRFTFAWLFVEL